MNLQDQVASLDLCKKLKELGIKQESLFYWFEFHSHNYLYCRQYEYSENVKLDIENGYSAFTVAELGEMLPVYAEKDNYVYEILMCMGDSEYTFDIDREEYILERSKIYRIN
jgi:hypothetical protein